MMKKLMMIALVLVAATLQAQEYKVAKSSGRLELYVGKVTVEGYAGNEIVFTSKSGKSETDSRAAGLRSVNGSGLEDNTGVGIHVAVKDNIIEVYQLKKLNHPDLKILVPKGIVVSFKHDSKYGGDAIFRNMENEIEISCQYNNIVLENITGPLTAKTLYGSIDAVFGNNVKGPISMVSVYSHIDITLPQTVKANLKMLTSYGELFMASGFPWEIVIKDGMQQWGDKVEGKLNGGGFALDLRSDYGKVYLRKK
ncbi:MAG: hypothetical protein LW821_11315 [Flammeovirgaceae bacterium]|jgi:hypothetical protein|nr:hypothetical protein [Flammeovirgaceae bacterium]